MPKTSQDLLAPVLLQAAALRWCSRWSHRSQRNVSSCSKACSSVRHTSLVSENLTNQKRFKLRKRGKLLANKNYIKNLFLLLSHWSWKMGDGKYLSFQTAKKSISMSLTGFVLARSQHIFFLDGLRLKAIMILYWYMLNHSSYIL